MDTLFILDEPTKGLHPSEVFLLLNILQKIIEQGGSIILVEHNLDMVAACDHVIDLGPSGGPQEGGYVVAEACPEKLLKKSSFPTGQALAEEFSMKSS